MTADQHAQLTTEWLDAVVTVKPGQPVLSRFVGREGTVKSVNWNGDCLVEWDAGQDVGWYDIAPECLAKVEVSSPDESGRASP